MAAQLPLEVLTLVIQQIERTLALPDTAWGFLSTKSTTLTRQTLDAVRAASTASRDFQRLFDPLLFRTAVFEVSKARKQANLLASERISAHLTNMRVVLYQGMLCLLGQCLNSLNSAGHRCRPIEA